MKPLSLLGLALVTVLTSCQFPVSGSSGKTVTVQLPGSHSRGGGPSDNALTAFPDGILGTLDHFVVKITDGTSSLVADQTVPASTSTVTFTGVPAGNHRLQLEAWTAKALTAVGDIPLQVTDDAMANVGPAVLAPVAGTGNGQFDLVLTVGPQIQALLTADSVTTRLRPLVYGAGSLDTTGSPLAPETVALTQPGENWLRLQAVNLPSGNYLLELLAAGYDLPTAGVSTIATLVVQVYADQISVLPNGTTLSGSLAESYLSAPLGLRVNLSDDGTTSLSWDGPQYELPTVYQVGYALDTLAAQPEASLPLLGGVDAANLVPGTDLHPQGDRYVVNPDLTAAPWVAGQPFRVFVRALRGPAVASTWTSLEVDPASTASDLQLGHLAFSGLAPGVTYRLQRTNSTGSEVLEERVFVTGTQTEEARFDFPGFVLHAGDKLNLVKIGNNSSESYPIVTGLLPVTTPGLYPSSTVFRAYVGYTNDDLFRNNRMYFLTTDDLDAPVGLAATATTLDWDETNGGQAWPNLFEASPEAWDIESDLNPVPDSPLTPTFPGTGSPVTFPGKWSPAMGKITGYRMRVAYIMDWNGDATPDVTVFGPNSDWVSVDKKAPEIFATLPNGSVFDVTTTNDIQLNVLADEDLGDYSVGIFRNDGSLAISPLDAPPTQETLPDARHYQWRTDWSLATGPQLAAWSTLPPGRYYLRVGVMDMASNTQFYNIPITLVGGPTL